MDAILTREEGVVKQATFLLMGLLTALISLGLACGGDEPAATPSPRATATPEVTLQPAPTTAATAMSTASTVPAGTSEVNLEISAEGDALEFDTSSFTVGAGSRVTLTYDNASTLFQHNWVLVQDGAKDDVAQRGTTYPNDGWLQPDDPEVIANTELIDPGMVGSVTFTAPPSGTYQFVCTFPGHNVTMFGSFEVSG